MGRVGSQTQMHYHQHSQYDEGEEHIMWHTTEEDPSGDGGGWNDGFTHLQNRHLKCCCNSIGPNQAFIIDHLWLMVLNSFT